MKTYEVGGVIGGKIYHNNVEMFMPKVDDIISLPHDTKLGRGWKIKARIIEIIGNKVVVSDL